MPSAARDTVINVAEMGHAVLHRDQSEGWWKGQAAGGCRRQQRHHGSGAGGHSASQFLLQESLIRSLATGQSLIRISAGDYSTSFSDQNFGWWLLYLFLWSEFRLVTTLPLSLVRISAGGYSTSFSGQNLGWWLLCLFLCSKLAGGYSTSFSNQNFGWWLLYLFLHQESLIRISAGDYPIYLLLLQKYGWWL